MAYEQSAANRIQRAETVSPRARARTVHATAPTMATAVQTSTVLSDGRRRPAPPGGPPSVSDLLTVVDTVALPACADSARTTLSCGRREHAKPPARSTRRGAGRDRPVIKDPLAPHRSHARGGALQGGREPASPPDLLGGLDDERQLGDLLVAGQRVALHGRGEAALRGQGQLLQRHVAGGLVDAPLEVVPALQLRALGGDQAQDDALARRHEAQRLESPGAGVVVLQEEPVDLQAAEEGLRDEVVTALGDPGRAEVAAAHVRGDRQPLRAAGQRGVDLPDVALVLVLGVAPLRG